MSRGFATYMYSLEHTIDQKNQAMQLASHLNSIVEGKREELAKSTRHAKREETFLLLFASKLPVLVKPWLSLGLNNLPS